MTDHANARREWTISGMDCASCAAKVTRAVERLPGARDVRVSLMAERISMQLDEAATPPRAIEDVVRQLGYGITSRAQSGPDAQGDAPHGDAPGGAADGDAADAGHPGAGHAHEAGHDHSHNDPAESGKSWYQTARGRLVIGSGVLLALAWAVEMIASPAIGKWAFVAACVIGLFPIARRAWAAARMGQSFTIEGLMTVAALGALFINAAEEAALVVFLFAVGEMLEGVAANKARDGIRALSALVPQTARLEEGARARDVPASSLRIGQVVQVRPGDRIPCDGTIIEGMSGIDESPVTGESIPRARAPGDAVLAGAINIEAALRIEVTREAADNTIARIIRLVEEAEESRAPTERFIDRFSRWYMPAIVALAALVVIVPPVFAGGDWGTWLYRGLALLLIGCPCALVISVPASIASALSAGARHGLLMKGGAVIEAAAGVTHVAFDKTGTLTRGRPQITDIVVEEGISEAALIEVAAGVEAGSAHPLARAILDHAASNGIAPQPSRGARALPGQGAEAEVAGALAWVASPRHAASVGGIGALGQGRSAALEEQGKTVVAVYRDGLPLGLIAMRDEPREDAAEAMRQLTQMGIGATMLTGDNARTAGAIAATMGLKVHADMLPEGKLTAIRAMSEAGGIMMIGDGINDAPALKQAGVGVAMGSGTDVALETADAAILRDRVTDVPGLIRLARATMGNIRQNIGIALGLKAVFLVTTIMGLTGLWIAILADTGATVLVTLNALRLLRFDPSVLRRGASQATNNAG